MTNLEYYKDEFVYMLNDDNYQPLLCNYFEKILIYSDCSCCPFCTKDETGCDYQKFVDWLLEEHREPIKLTKFEYDLLESLYRSAEDRFLYMGVFKYHAILRKLKGLGHFKGVKDDDMTLDRILDNCEVVE